MNVTGGFDPEIIEAAAETQSQYVADQMQELNELDNKSRLYNPAFMQMYTAFDDFESFKHSSPVPDEELESVDVMDDPEFEQFVAKTTDFDDPDEMVRTAVADFVSE